MEQTWRWFGPDDAIALSEIRQTGATGIVTALHHIPYGVAWHTDEIAKRKAAIEADANLGLRWSVVESLPVAEPIKLGEGDLSALFDNYRVSLRNLASLGVTTVCYIYAGARLDADATRGATGRWWYSTPIQRPRIRSLRLLYSQARRRRS